MMFIGEAENMWRKPYENIIIAVYFKTYKGLGFTEKSKKNEIEYTVFGYVHFREWQIIFQILKLIQLWH